MTNRDITPYSHLWTTEKNSWALVQVPGASLPVIYNPTTKNILIIEDDDCLALVLEAMRASGVRLFESFSDLEKP